MNKDLIKDEIHEVVYKPKIEENKSEYNSHPSYSLIRDSIIVFPNGKEYPWEHWISWNNFFKDF